MIRIHVFLANRAEEAFPYGLRFARVTSQSCYLTHAFASSRRVTSKAIPSRLLRFMLLHQI